MNVQDLKFGDRFMFNGDEWIVAESNNSNSPIIYVNLRTGKSQHHWTYFA